MTSGVATGVASAVGEAVKHLESLGAELVEVSLYTIVLSQIFECLQGGYLFQAHYTLQIRMRVTVVHYSVCFGMQVSIPELEMALPAYYVLAISEASSNLARYDGVRYGLQQPVGLVLLHDMMQSRPVNVDCR